LVEEEKKLKTKKHLVIGGRRQNEKQIKETKYICEHQIQALDFCK